MEKFPLSPRGAREPPRDRPEITRRASWLVFCTAPAAMSTAWPTSARPPRLAEPSATTRAVRLGGTSLLVWMAAAIAVVASLAFWDARRESTAALRDFAEDQSLLAATVASAIEARLGSTELTRAPLHAIPIADIAASVRAIEQPPDRILLLQRPGASTLSTTDDRDVSADFLIDALARGERSLRLSRGEASSLGLPERTAMAGLKTLHAPSGGTWGIAVIASAERERDREARAQWRLVLGVLVAAGLVLAFGGMALRKQRAELDLSREIAVAAAQTERDERLVRADKLATLGALATGIAHEVSTPLGVIMGRAEQLAARVDGDPRARRAVDAITAETERITRIIRAFLSLARGDRPEMRRVDPIDVARTCTELVEHRFAKAGVHLALRATPPLPAIACDRRLFEQAIINLLLNACDACAPGGHVELRVRADGSRVAFVVTDDGAGIRPEAAARATEPFFTTKPEGKGTGLGLAIANEIVKHHNGALTIGPRDAAITATTPPAARGTRACIELPVTNEVDHG